MRLARCENWIHASLSAGLVGSRAMVMGWPPSAGRGTASPSSGPAARAIAECVAAGVSSLK